MNAQKLFSKKWIVFATAVLCTLLWGSAFPGIKTGYRMFRIASQDTADQLMFAGARFLIAGILTLLISFFVEKKEHKKERRKQWPKGQIVLVAFVQTALQYVFYYIGMAHVTGVKGAIVIPHLGASTEESEENCAEMAVDQLMNYLENGNIVNSVNYPNCDLGEASGAARITVHHKNLPNMIGQLTAILAADGHNISNMLNKSKGEWAYSMFDMEKKAPTEETIKKMEQIDGVVRVRVL